MGAPSGASGAEVFAEVTLVDPSLSHLDHPFTYAVPPSMEIRVGSLVRVPFRRRPRSGVVTALKPDPDIEQPLPVRDVLGPGLSGEQVDLARWMAERYLATFGEALAAAVPPRVVSEEAVPPPRTHDAPATGAAAGWVDAYRGGSELARALRAGGAGGIVWRPRVDEPRAPAIVSMVSAAIERGKGALVLVPEVRAGGEVAAALRQAFGEAVAWLGSDRPARERYRAWLALRAGAARVAVGGRGAVLAPVEELGLIVVDDEGHAAYKEGRAPRFHARAVAAERARRAEVPIVLVGLPPSIEARAACEGDAYSLVAPARALERTARPPVTIMRRSPGERLVPSAGSLRMARATLDEGSRVVVLVHRGGEALARTAERVVRILRPQTHAILDAGAPRAQLRRDARRAALLIATPVIAKDLMLQGVGLLVIVEADAALTRPSFRAAEEVFSTWWRTAIWVARGRVAVETQTPTHPAIVALTRWDPEVLWRAEAERRRELRYPPYAAVARVDVPADRADEVAGALQGAGLEVLGPVVEEADAVVVVRAARRDELLAALRPVADRWRAADEPMRIDVDPWEVLATKWRS